MCTTFCNCPASNTTTGNWLDLYTETTLNSNNRTKGTGTSAYTTLTLSATNATTFSTFWSCYSKLKNLGYTSVKGVDISSITSGTTDLISTIESEFACSGICTSGAFYFFKDIKEGPPGKNCLDGVKDAFKKWPVAIGIVLLITFFFTFCTWILSYSICCHKGEK